MKKFNWVAALLALLVFSMFTVSYAQGKGGGGKPSGKPGGEKGGKGEGVKKWGNGEGENKERENCCCKHRHTHEEEDEDHDKDKENHDKDNKDKGKGDNKDDKHSGKNDKDGDGNSGQGDDKHKKYEDKWIKEYSHRFRRDNGHDICEEWKKKHEMCVKQLNDIMNKCRSTHRPDNGFWCDKCYKKLAELIDEFEAKFANHECKKFKNEWAEKDKEKKDKKGNNGVGNGKDPQPPGNPPENDGDGSGKGDPGNKKDK